MPNYNIKIQDFEGPLDLLMHLIEKDKVDIYDIPIVDITEQYITYLNAMKEFDMDVASDFLVMAATLLQIKSRMLLPKPPVESAEEQEDPRQMLVDMLVEYRKIRIQAKMLTESLATALGYHQRKPMQFPDIRKKIKPLSFDDLIDSLNGLLTIQEHEPALIERQRFNVQDKMSKIIDLLEKNNHSLEFSALITNNVSRSEIIASFLAILELMRLNRITIRQARPFSTIFIFLREDMTDVL
ncbi:MAG: ScpA family protein [Acidaminococcaceae bacterium]